MIDSDTAIPAFTISSPPSPQDNLQLSTDFLAQDRHQRSNDISCIAEVPSGPGFFGGLHGRGDVRDITSGERRIRLIIANRTPSTATWRISIIFSAK